jgi:hypothetical protein
LSWVLEGQIFATRFGQGEAVKSATERPFYIIIRLHWLSKEVLDGKWKGPAMTRAARTAPEHGVLGVVLSGDVALDGSS